MLTNWFLVLSFALLLVFDVLPTQIKWYKYMIGI